MEAGNGVGTKGEGAGTGATEEEAGAVEESWERDRLRGGDCRTTSGGSGERTWTARLRPRDDWEGGGSGVAKGEP